MPTPESALFLAKKPQVPPTFDGVDYADTPRLKAAQDAVIREQWVKSMMARLVREELDKCYRREGVNHLEKCGVLRGRCRRPIATRHRPDMSRRALSRGSERCKGPRISIRAAKLCSQRGFVTGSNALRDRRHGNAFKVRAHMSFQQSNFSSSRRLDTLSLKQLCH